MRVPSLASGAPLRPLVDFFARSIASFQRSDATFQVVCTLPRPPRDAAPHDALPTPIPPNTRPPSLIVLDSSFNPPTRAHLRMATSALETTSSHPSGSRLLLLLAINNADKAPKPAAFEHRLAMMWAFAADVQSAMQKSPQCQSSSPPAHEKTETSIPTIDIALSTEPYFHDKSGAIAAAEFYNPMGNKGEGAETEQVVLAGYDTLIRIFNPKYYGPAGTGVQEGGVTPMQNALGPFLRRAKLRVTMRPDDEWGDGAEQRAYLEDLVSGDGLERVGGKREWGGRIELVEGQREGEEVVSSTYARDAAGEKDWERLGRMVTPAVEGVVEELQLYVK